MTTNGQLNYTCIYQIIPTNFTCSMISVFVLKARARLCVAKKIFCQRSQILIIVVKCYQRKIFGYIEKQKNIHQNPYCVGGLLQYSSAFNFSFPTSIFLLFTSLTVNIEIKGI